MLPLDAYPHLLDAVLSHAAWSTLPALRATSHTTAAFANAVLYSHVVVTLHGDTLALLDPFRLARIPGLRFDPAHAECARTLARLKAHTHTFDFVAPGADLDALPRTQHAREVVRLAEGRRIRSAEPITYLLDSPHEVVLHHSVDFAPRGAREFHNGRPFNRLVLRLDISEAHTRAFSQSLPSELVNNLQAAITNIGYMFRPRELVLLITQGSGTPWRLWKEWQGEVVGRPSRPLDCLLTSALTPIVGHVTTFAGLEGIDPRILSMDPWETEDTEARLAALRTALARTKTYSRALFQASENPNRLSPAQVDFNVVSLDAYRRGSGLDEYEWRLMMTKPGVKLQFPATWKVRRVSS
ncbi:hypothetical protein Q8F55_009221 [Vanrija albida]|uniref:Uncharacterized protein n=1 Tax=Vanrija albida TaxID=181172 RepID=A0ABR3PT12_9TREE